MTNLPPVSHYGQNRAVLFGHLGALVQGGAASTILLQHQHATALYLLSACLSLPTEFIYISHTLNCPQSHFVCIYIVREISRVALIFFFNVFSAFQCLFITFCKFIHAKERICVGYLCVAMSLFKATDSFYLENLHVLGR